MCLDLSRALLFSFLFFLFFFFFCATIVPEFHNRGGTVQTQHTRCRRCCPYVLWRTNRWSCVQEQGCPGRSKHDQQIYLLVLQGKKGEAGAGGLGSGVGSVSDPHGSFPAGFIQGPPGPPGPPGRKVRHWRLPGPGVVRARAGRQCPSLGSVAWWLGHRLATFVAFVCSAAPHAFCSSRLVAVFSLQLWFYAYVLWCAATPPFRLFSFSLLLLGVVFCLFSVWFLWVFDRMCCFAVKCNVCISSIHALMFTDRQVSCIHLH